MYTSGHSITLETVGKWLGYSLCVNKRRHAAKVWGGGIDHFISSICCCFVEWVADDDDGRL